MNNFVGIVLAVLFFSFSINTFAQTGPGGVGNAGGTNGQPKNVLWLDVSALTYLDGDDLSTWNDFSGNSNNLTQPVSSYTPIFRNNVTDNVNGHPVAEFSKADNRIVLNPFNDMPTSGITTFFIYKTTDSNDGLLSYNTSGQDNALLLFNNDNLITDINASRNTSGVNLNSGNWQIMSHKWNSSGGNLIINLNGDQVLSVTHQNGAAIPGGGSLAFGGEQDSPDGGYDPNQDFDGDIAEIVMYNSYLNSAQRIIIENYLSQKYALAFATASNDKFGNDADFNSSYIYNIAGIGRESDGVHTQTVSGGLYAYEWNSTLANGEYVMLAHDNTTNNSTTIRTDAEITASGAQAAWARQWYVEKTSSDGIDVKLIFDFKEALSDGKYPTNVANYVLLYRSAATGNYNKVTVAGQGIFDADQVYFNISDANFTNGYYTIGTDDQTNSPLEGVDNRTWYALASGDWDVWEYWTLDPSGALPNNPAHEIPSDVDQVVIHTGKTITLSSNDKILASITVDGILQLGTTTGHNFTTIKGSGRIRLASDNFPTGDATHFITAGLGEGTVVWQGGSYDLSLATGSEFFNMEFDLDNATNTLTLLSDLTINGSLLVETGVLQINDNSSSTSLNIETRGNVIVTANGQITTGIGDARHQFDMYGDLTNAGTVKFTNRTSAAYLSDATDGIVDANFLNGVKNQTIQCNGLTNFYRIEIDKGSDKTYILDIQASDAANFNLFGYANQSHGSTTQLTDNANALGLLRGTVKIGSNVNIPVLSRASNYNISEAARLWVAGGTVLKNSGNALVPYGIIEVSDGLLETTISSGITTRNSGLIKVSGGIINTNVIRTSVDGVSVGGYIQSGGTVNIVNTGTGDYYHFCLTYPGNTFNMSGGTLHVFNSTGSGNNQGGIFIASSPENINVTGGTVIAEIETSANPFIITSKAPFYNLILRNTYDNTTHHILDEAIDVGSTNEDLAAQPLVVLNDLTIEDDCFLDHNGEDITIGRSFYIAEGSQRQSATPRNYGLLYDAAKPNTLTFNGSTNGDFYIGHAVSDAYEMHVWNFTVNKTNDAEIVLKGDPEKDPTHTDLSSHQHYNRLINVEGTTNIQNGTFNQGHQSIRLYGPVYVEADGVLGVYEFGTTPQTAYIMLKDDGTSGTDLNTETGAQLGNFKLNPGNGNTVGISSDTYIKRIGYYSGRMNMRTYNLKLDYLNNDSTTNNYTGGSTNKMIYSDANASDGGLSLLITGNETYHFPLGTEADATPRYTYADVTISNLNAGDSGYITIRPVDGELKTTNLSGSQLLTYYWRVGYDGFATPPIVKYEFKYRGHDVDNENRYYPGKVLDEDPYTRSYEQKANIVTGSNLIIFDDTGGTSGNTGNGFTLEKANYTAGAINRFTGTVTIYYSRFLGNAANTNWTTNSSWTLATNSTYEKHDSRQPAASSYPQAGDIAVVGWVPYGDPNYTDGYPHGIEVNSNVDFAELVFSQMLDANNGNPTFRKYAYNFQFRPTVCINPGGVLNGNAIRGEGMFWCRSTGTSNHVDPDFSAIDMGDFIAQDSSYIVYESTSDAYIYNNIPAIVPNLMIAGNGWGANDRNFNISTDVEVRTDFELLGDVNLILSNGATGDITVKRDVRIFRSTANGNDSGGNGEIAFPNDASRTIEIFGDLKLINEHAIVHVRTPDNTTVNIGNLIIHGNIFQDNTSGGGLQLFSAIDEDYVELTLTGASNNDYTVDAGSSASLYSLIIDKGTSQTNTFTFNNSFTLNGPTLGVGVSKALELQNGTLVLNDATLNINLTTGDDNFPIPSTAALEVRQGQVNANGNSGILLDGKLLVSGGTVDMTGAGEDNYIQYSASGSAEIEVAGGSLLVGSQIRRGTSSTEGILKYTQTGGTVLVGVNTAPEGSRGVFEILNTGSSFTHTGGDLNIVRQQTNATFASLYLDPENSDLSGSTITLGHTGTPINQEFGIYSIINLQNLVLNTTNSPKAKMWTIPLSINGDLTIQSGTEFKANGLDLNLYGNFTNSGTFTADQNTTYIKGSSDQEINGNTTFYNLTNQNTTNLNLAAGTTDIIVENILSLEANTTTNDNSNNIYVHGNINNEATHIYGGGGDGITLNGLAQQVMSGNGTYGKLTINNGAGVTLPVGSAPTITDFLKLEAGIFNIAGNLLTLSSSCQIQEANPFGNTNMIQTNISFTDNGVKKYFPAGTGSFTYPMGSGGKYTPIVISVTQNTSTTGYLIVKPADEMHPSIIEDSEAPDPEIVDKDNVLQYYWVLTANGFTDGSGTIEFYYHDGDTKVTAPYDITNYITAKLLTDNAGSWTKIDDNSKFDQTSKKLIFDFSDAADVDISGDYTAGVDGSTFLGAIPDEVPLYASKGSGVTLDWNTADTWRVDDGTGTWVLPATIGLPDIPKGSRVRILNGDIVQANANYISAYTTEILGTLDVNTTFGNRVGSVSGTGTLYTEVGNLPAGYYETFFSSTGGTVEFGGSTSYSVLSNITQVNNLIFSGIGDRELPNLDLTVLGDLLLSDVSSSAPNVINEFDQKISIQGNITYNAGTFDAGTGASAIVELNGSSAQTISGSGSFTVPNAFYHFLMNNINGVTLASPIDITQTLEFDNGVIYTDATNILKLTNTLDNIVTDAGAGKYVDGPMQKNISSGNSFNFPVGNAGRYGNIYVTNSSVSDYWEVEYLNHNPNDEGYNPANYTAPLTVVSDGEYWRVNGPTANAEISLRYDGQSGMPSDANMRIAEWKPPATSAWEEFASNPPSGGTISSSTTTSFTSGTGKFFTLSSIYTIQFPVWNGSQSTVWNLAANWDNNLVPNSLDDISIPDVANDPVISISAECGAITLQSGAMLTINAGHSLSAYGDFDNDGTLILKSPSNSTASASFIDNGTITGGGNVQVERYITSHESHYISAPINGGNANSDLFTAHGSSFNPNFYFYNEDTDLDGNPTTAPPGSYDPDNLVGGWSSRLTPTSSTISMEASRGYSFYTDINGAVTFQGAATTLNTGDKSVSGLSYTDNDPMPGPLPSYYDGWHLVGNPYPSAIDWDLVRGNITNMDDAIYVWDGTQYASYVGGVSGGTLNQNNYIAPMQAFFVHATADNGGFTLNNSHRVHSPTTNFKSTKSSVPDNFIRLRMMANGKSDAMVVYFKPNATEEFDGVYDAFRLFSWNADADPISTYNNDVPHLFTVTPEEKVALSINALPERIVGDLVIPIGIRIGTSGVYTITKDQLNIPDVNVYLVDKLENKTIYLNEESSYAFTFAAGDVRDRFELRTQLNRAPFIENSLSAQITNEDNAFTYVINKNTFVELDEGDHIVSYTATMADGSALPAWLSFDPLTRTFSGTPSNNDIGTIRVLVEVKDVPGATVSQAFDLEVVNVNDAPVLVNSITDIQATEDINFEFTFGESTFNDVDVDDVLTYSAKRLNGNDLPTWLSFNPASRTFTGFPENDDVSILDIVVTATDQSGETADDAFVLQVVNVNDVPELVNEIPDQSIDEGLGYSYTVPSNTFNDIDIDDELQLSATLDDGGNLPQWIIFDGITGQFSGTAENPGELNILVTATDKAGATSSDGYTLTVKGTTGINDLSTSVVNIYPNPTQGLFFITTDYYSEDLMIYIRDFSGRAVKEIKPLGKKTEINVSELASGMYFIELRDKDESKVFKLNLNK